MSPAYGNGRGPQFTVSLSQAVLAQGNALHQAALEAGKGEAFASAMSRIDERLRTAPRSFGEPQYSLNSLRLVVYHGAVSPVAVSYAVHGDLPIVFVRSFQLMS